MSSARESRRRRIQLVVRKVCVDYTDWTSIILFLGPTLRVFIIFVSVRLPENLREERIFSENYCGLWVVG